MAAIVIRQGVEPVRGGVMNKATPVVARRGESGPRPEVVRYHHGTTELLLSTDMYGGITALKK